MNIQDILIEIQDLNEELTFLRTENAKLNRMVKGLKLNNSKLTLERNQLVDRLNKRSVFETTSDEFLKAELAAEQAEAETVAAFGSFLGDDF